MAVLHLKNHAQFQAVLTGVRAASTAHFVLHHLQSDRLPWRRPDAASPVAGSDRRSAGGEHWIGTVVPKRWARRAVTRNAIKRQIYHVVSAFEAVLPPGAFVVRQRLAYDRAEFSSASSPALKRAVRQELEQLLHRCQPRDTP